MPAMTAPDSPFIVPAPSGAPEPPDTLIPYREVIRRAGIARQTIDRLERKGKFPKRIRIGHATRWSARAIQHWIDERIADAGRR